MSPNRWLAALAAARVPAFHCRRVVGEVTIVSRTPEFVGVMQALAGRLDECSLLSRLDDQWPETGTDGSFTIAAAHDPAWQCALQPLDDDADDHLAILSLPAGWQQPNDAFFSIVENLPDVVTRFDREFRYRYANPPMARLTGIPHETRLGRTQFEVGTSNELAGTFQATYRQVFDTGEPVELEFDYPGTTGLRHYLGRATPEFDHEGRVATVLSVVRDITELKRLQHQLEQLAGTDPLTSLLNRRSFIARLGTELDRVRREQGELSLLVLDLNNFKHINDRFGHAGGDQVLEAVGRILLSETTSHHIAARLGGDEFCVALIDTDEAAARRVAQRIGERVGNIAVDSAEPIGVGVSVGVARADTQDTTALDLLARVDKLMYQVKFGGADETGSNCR
ncbi:sensor domain-containing diguanylate cyclase [Mycolicibacterium aichiense]|uniref:Diguanylate cyclase n=1 Tax=Mycolicibacterium aichiense TaxID=1799 RepID=A0AAD1HKJ4_9MYCO|nr:GGDEF domain-containing protein [Mycolicibacterium aichiense]MCV7019231.1 GGDEF domain-containing protein [Mycolicibacterium aichiense]BBX06384.1 hypothetical protein MAIC_11870 [Mycolicibacterium aichiense]